MVSPEAVRPLPRPSSDATIDNEFSIVISYLSFNLPSVLLKKRAEKFDIKYKNHANLLCQMVK